MTPGADPHWSRHLDPWVWYTERLPAWLALILPFLLAPAPVLLAALVAPHLVARVGQLELLALAGLQFSIPFGITVNIAPWFILACSLLVQFLLLVWIVRNVELFRRWERFERFVERHRAMALKEGGLVGFRASRIRIYAALLAGWRRFDAFLTRQEQNAVKTYERRPWLRKFHFVGLTLFIFMPVASGLFTGVFIGKLTGMSDRRLVASIFLGTVLWAIVFVYVGDVIGDFVRRLF